MDITTGCIIQCKHLHGHCVRGQTFPWILDSRQVFHSVSEIHKGNLRHLLHRTDYGWRADTTWLAIQDSRP